ncbi:MAG: UDP-N-acetylmuramyl-tripeptide synthetase [Patescibacteria group bacterium]|nr:UDP-N-acetylmuramyl-tripeptide synthetase [Patescibacteria group bacterium]MDE2226554.1 UDP-N-acetylmuramyl-tripeptide synthetase [Patescibacteria group bacterium]
MFYGFPGKIIFVIGVTGTKGKTTTLELLNAILEAAGKKTALMSSLRVKMGEQSKKSNFGNTMPGRFYIQRFLSDAVRAGCKYALVEVTSQGAVLYRHRFINWNAGVLTNLSPEHIESHGSFKNYRRAKLGFLNYVGVRGGRIFINSEDENSGFFLEKLAKFNPIVFSRETEESERVFPKFNPARLAVATEPPKFLPSDFNRDNVAAAAAVAHSLGIPEKIIEEALLNFRGVQGRAEFLQRRPFSVVVDYAHTPDSLRKIYEALRVEAVKGSRFICVLGAAGGGRDKWKRPEMGRVAAEFCDEIFLTDEDPYDENPGQILSEIKSGIPDGKSLVTREIPDRREAIKAAVGLAGNGDTIIATGKGSEDWIHVANGRKIPWNERAILEEVLNENKNGRT